MGVLEKHALAKAQGPPATFPAFAEAASRRQVAPLSGSRTPCTLHTPKRLWPCWMGLFEHSLCSHSVSAHLTDWDAIDQILVGSIDPVRQLNIPLA